MEEETDLLTQVAFQVILNAGDARNTLDKALDAAAEFRFDEVRQMIEDAESLITKAHNAQTGLIQRQAAGEQFPYSLLFVHAQDTLMTIDSEIHFLKRLLPTLEALHVAAINH
ncbi:PTS lactose/cellobiose transporter subunit IIA [Atopobium sp. oral taxon 416]|uniref:PTS lactose/cellobiose transporter subunit IIA n=1 Tax=Atopobium sp. oral taxon 416 TaxID=712157 RepID=UPI001BA745E2|nr:PTS lactose/cellobiose transporter subunit IIA [Atopobium sp. oral taxon 416]QUC03536.1 PTS lactose/cellobiose transporter subunit IIA [Atopobium sp. oral taxon 416]